MDKLELTELLNHIDPSFLGYQEWVNVGMALKEEGYSASDWDTWSRKDSARYKPGECFAKWSSFTGNVSSKVTGGTIVQYAKNQGWRSATPSKEINSLDWDSVISAEEDFQVVKPGWVEDVEVNEPSGWNPAAEIVTYLSTLFDTEDFVGYVTPSFKDKDERWKPGGKGNFKRTAGELMQELQKCNGDIGAVLGDYNEEAGAWIRFNPLDGTGIKNTNVVEFKYALVESDNMAIDKQNALLRELELPIAVLVHSGGKSLHAIVRVDAGSYEEYRKKVDFLYTVCKKNGLVVDEQNKNPSRLSRLPGVVRNGKKQFIVAKNIGKANWGEWKEWIEGINDDLPDPEKLADVWDNLPELAPQLIHGVLRQGHKMLMAGPSKAGKSFALIELCIAIAEGNSWIGWPCTKGGVLYVNLELDRASCLHRFRDVYKALEITPENIGNIDIWNLRGKTLPMDKLAPKLIRRAAKKGYIAVVIDPIYKVITGDENAADQMAHFTNQFDKIATDIGSAVIYCHHHSKGYQGNKKAMDRASGSGVFARDPDALLDLTELEVTDALWKAEENKAICNVYTDMFREKYYQYYEEEIGQDDLLSAAQMRDHAERKFNKVELQEAINRIEIAKVITRRKTAWRIDGTLREFAKFEPVDMWFDYPRHLADMSGVLKDLEPEAEKPLWKKGIDSRKSPEKKKEERTSALEIAFSSLEMDDEEITLTALSEEMEVSKTTVKRRIKEHGGFEFISESGKDTLIKRKE